MVQDGPAAKSDLRLGDVITAVDGQPVATAQQLRSKVRTRKIGSKVVLDVVRGGKELKVSVSPEAWPEDMAITARRGAPPTAPQATDLGMTVKPLTRELAKEMRIEFSEGVVVTAVDPDSVAAAKGVEPGDIITQVNRSETTTIRQFREAVEGADLTKGVVVNLVRGGVSRFVVLKETNE